MNLTDLPLDCLHEIGSYLTIGDNVNLSIVIPTFRRMCNTLTKSIGVLNVQNKTSISDNYIKRFDLFERWNCSDLDHIPQELVAYSDSLTQKCRRCNQFVINCLLSQYPMIESLDLRGVHLTLDIISQVHLNCKNLNCLKLNFVKIDEDALSFLSFSICPRIKHLSFDNLIFENTSLMCFVKQFEFFTNLENLQQLEFSLFYSKNLNIIMKIFSLTSLTFLSLQLLMEKRIKNNHLEIFDDIVKLKNHSNNFKNVLYLKVKSNLNFKVNHKFTNALKLFENVRAINLNYMNYNCPDFVYDFNCWSKLESLSVDFYELSNSNELLKKFLNGSYHANLKSLRILSINLLRSSAFELRKKCINLRRLQLIDVSFKSIDYLFDCLLHLEYLDELHIEYTFKELYPNYINQSELESMNRHFEFPFNKIASLEKLVRHHPTIKKVSLIDWPNLKWLDLNHVKQIADEKGISICFCPEK